MTPCASGARNWTGAIEAQETGVRDQEIRGQESGIRETDVDNPQFANSRVGVLGGTFDPIHIGHLILAEEARDQLDPGSRLLRPGRQPAPQAGPPSGAGGRARADDRAGHRRQRRLPGLARRRRPARPALHVDMVQMIQGQLPPGCELFFLMGFDSLTELPTWHEPARLIAACHLVALTRHDIELDWAKLEAALPGIRRRVTILDMPELEIASHQIQQRIREGRSIRYLVPDRVRQHISRGRDLRDEGRMTKDESQTRRPSIRSFAHSSFVCIRHST